MRAASAYSFRPRHFSVTSRTSRWSAAASAGVCRRCGVGGEVPLDALEVARRDRASRPRARSAGRHRVAAPPRRPPSAPAARPRPTRRTAAATPPAPGRAPRRSAPGGRPSPAAVRARTGGPSGDRARGECTAGRLRAEARGAARRMLTPRRAAAHAASDPDAWRAPSATRPPRMAVSGPRTSGRLGLARRISRRIAWYTPLAREEGAVRRRRPRRSRGAGGRACRARLLG